MNCTPKSRPPLESNIPHNLYLALLAGISCTARCVFMQLFFHAPWGQTSRWVSGSHPSYQTLADELGICVNTVKAAIEELEQAGLIIVMRRPRKVNQYQILNPTVSNSAYEVFRKKDKDNPIPEDNSDYRDSEKNTAAEKGQDFFEGGEKKNPKLSVKGEGEKKNPETPVKAKREKDPWNPQEPIPIQNLIPTIPLPVDETTAPDDQEPPIDTTPPTDNVAPSDNLAPVDTTPPTNDLAPIKQELAVHCPNINIPAALEAVKRHDWTLGEVQALIILKQRDPSVRALDAVILARLRTGRRVEDWEPVHLERQEAKRRTQQERENKRRRQWEKTRQQHLEAENKRRRRQLEEQHTQRILGALSDDRRREIEVQARLNLSREIGLPPRMLIRQVVEPEMARLVGVSL